MLYAKLNSPSTFTPLQLHPVWDEAFAALRKLNTDSPLGITELRGKDMFINVHTYETLPESECRFEGHRDMIDVQYIIAGGELVDWVLKEELEEDGEYLVEKDFQFYQAPADRGLESVGRSQEAVQVESLKGSMVEGKYVELESINQPFNQSTIQPQTLTRVHLKAGYFGVFFPEDGHRPKIQDGIHQGVYKAVVKINRALLDGV